MGGAERTVRMEKPDGNCPRQIDDGARTRFSRPSKKISQGGGGGREGPDGGRGQRQRVRRRSKGVEKGKSGWEMKGEPLRSGGERKKQKKQEGATRPPDGGRRTARGWGGTMTVRGKDLQTELGQTVKRETTESRTRGSKNESSSENRGTGGRLVGQHPLNIDKIPLNTQSGKGREMNIASGLMRSNVRQAAGRRGPRGEEV